MPIYLINDIRKEALKLYNEMEKELSLPDQKSFLGYAFGVALDHYTEAEIREIRHFFEVLKGVKSEAIV